MLLPSCCLRILIIFTTLSFVMFNSEQTGHCPKITVTTTASPTKCVAGRRLYANWSFVKIPGDERKIQELLPPSWLAAINTNYAGITNICSGALINDRYVITAQRCVLPPLEPDHIKINLANEEYHPLQIIQHPNFEKTDPRTSHNDVALLKLQNPLIFTKQLFPLQLVTEKEILTLSSSTLMFGLLQNKFVGIRGILIRGDDCKRFNGYYNYSVTNEILCSKIESGDCFNLQSMTGAALAVDKQKRIYRIDVLIGILTWWWPKNRPCIARENPFVFVNLQSKLAWIVNNTSDAQYCRY